jgi:hypothetical protein
MVACAYSSYIVQKINKMHSNNCSVFVVPLTRFELCAKTRNFVIAGYPIISEEKIYILKQTADLFHTFRDSNQTHI